MVVDAWWRSTHLSRDGSPPCATICSWISRDHSAHSASSQVRPVVYVCHHTPPAREMAAQLCSHAAGLTMGPATPCTYTCTRVFSGAPPATSGSDWRDRMSSAAASRPPSAPLNAPPISSMATILAPERRMRSRSRVAMDSALRPASPGVAALARVPATFHTCRPAASTRVDGACWCRPNDAWSSPSWPSATVRTEAAVSYSITMRPSGAEVSAPATAGAPDAAASATTAAAVRVRVRVSTRERVDAPGAGGPEPRSAATTGVCGGAAQARRHGGRAREMALQGIAHRVGRRDLRRRGRDRRGKAPEEFARARHGGPRGRPQPVASSTMSAAVTVVRYVRGPVFTGGCAYLHAPRGRPSAPRRIHARPGRSIGLRPPVAGGRLRRLRMSHPGAGTGAARGATRRGVRAPEPHPFSKGPYRVWVTCW